MTDITTDGGGHDRTELVDIQIEMQRSYIDYAMSVIVGRALPDVRDGLKPVHRKILYGMYDSGFRPDRNYVKCAAAEGRKVKDDATQRFKGLGEMNATEL